MFNSTMVGAENLGTYGETWTRLAEAPFTQVTNTNVFEYDISMYVEIIEKEYQRMTSAAEKAWAQSPNVGKFIGLPAGYSKIGICTGSLYKPSNSLSHFFNLLEQIAMIDSALVLVPRNSAHFTFLALADHNWEDLSELPPETKDLKSIMSQRFNDFSWNLNDLRIIPGNNFLLLAGIPDSRSYMARQQLADSVMSSTWQKHIHQRYKHKDFPFPPTIWHTTLCRYQYELLPESVRELFRRFKEENFGPIQLGKPELRAINYDWTFSSLIT